MAGRVLVFISSMIEGDERPGARNTIERSLARTRVRQRSKSRGSYEAYLHERMGTCLASRAGD